MSVLSKEPDGLGFYYGFIEGDLRRIDVREEHINYTFADEPYSDFFWVAYVAGKEIGWFLTKERAEESAVEYIKTNKLQT